VLTGIVAKKIQMGLQQREPAERITARALIGIGLAQVMGHGEWLRDGHHFPLLA
jgi:hypothetical protein